jgi:DNA-binding MarR family transcriptional regulator
LHVASDELDLRDPQSVAHLIATVRATGAICVIIDTRSRATSGTDENAQKDMSLIVKYVTKIKEVTGATVLTLHHSSLTGNLRGSTVFPAALDVTLKLDRDQKGRLWVTNPKNRFAREARPLPLRKVEDGGHVTFTALGATEKMKIGKVSLTPVEVEILVVLSTGTYAIKQLKRAGVNRSVSTISEALGRMVERGWALRADTRDGAAIHRLTEVGRTLAEQVLKVQAGNEADWAENLTDEPNRTDG